MSLENKHKGKNREQVNVSGIEFVIGFISDISSGNFERFGNITPLIIALLSPSIPILFLFRSDIAKEMDIFKMLLICIPINVMLFFVTFIFISGSWQIIDRIELKKINNLLQQIIQLKKEIHCVTCNENKQKLKEEKKELLFIFMKLMKSRRKKRYMVLSDSENRRNKDDYFTATLVNTAMGLATVAIKIDTWRNPRDNVYINVIECLFFVYLVIGCVFLVNCIILMYQCAKGKIINIFCAKKSNFYTHDNNVRGEKRIVKNKKIVIYIIGLTINILFICVVPIILEIASNKVISYEIWLQYCGSIGGALLGGSIAGVGVFISFKENRKMLGTQVTNEEINDYKNFIKIVDNIQDEVKDYRDKIEKENLDSLGGSEKESFEHEFKNINYKFIYEIFFIGDTNVMLHVTTVSNTFTKVMSLYSDIYVKEKKEEQVKNIEDFKEELDSLKLQLVTLKSALMAKIQKLYEHKYTISQSKF